MRKMIFFALRWFWLLDTFKLLKKIVQIVIFTIIGIYYYSFDFETIRIYVPEVLNIHMNEIYKKLNTTK